VGFGELGESRIMCFLIANYRGIGFDDDFVLVAVIDDGALLTEGVELTTRQQLIEQETCMMIKLIIKGEKQVAEAGERNFLKSKPKEKKLSEKQKDSPRAD
jgi:hypothetical protein